MIGKTSLTLLSFLFINLVFSQQAKSVDLILDEIRTNSKFEDGGADWIQFSEQLLALESQPISINKSDLTDLLLIPFLNKVQIHNLIQYRKRSGYIKSYFELLSIKGYNKKLIQWLIPFTTLETSKNKVKLKNVFRFAKYDVALAHKRLYPKKQGFINSTFAGDRNALLLRYRMNYSNTIYAGLTLQKDEGEVYLQPDNRAPDYSSFHLEIRNIGKVDKIIIGDFLANYGQGLSLWSSLSYGKMASTTEIQRFGKGIRYYSGAHESRFFRGVAISSSVNKLTVDLFASSNAIDASTTDGSISSINETGLHRTSLEQIRRKNENVKVLGGHLQFDHHSFEIGVTSLYYQYSMPLKMSQQAYNTHKLRGIANGVLSIDYQWVFGDNILFGEISRSITGGMALQTSFHGRPVDALVFVISIRKIEPSYQTLYFAPFSESGMAGESGVYTGLEYNLNRKIKINFYIDRYSFDWLRYKISTPSSGLDILTQLEVQPLTDLNLIVRFQYKTQKIDFDNDQTTPDIIPTSKNLLRFQMRYNISRLLRWTSRLELKKINTWSDSKGYLFYQDLTFNIEQKNIKLNSRVCFFDSDDFRTTMYALEDDIPFSYNLEAYYHKGIKYYIQLKKSISKLDAYIRYSHWFYPNLTSISSGNNQVLGNKMSETHLMIRLRF